MIHIWDCKINDGNTTDELMEVTEDWLAAAKSMEGGSELRVLIEYPMAADAGFGEFTFVLVVPGAKTWGVFMDGYDASAAEEVDEAWNEVARCSSSSIWQSVEVGGD